MHSLHHGDCLEVLRGLESASADALVTDPPAGIAFMGAAWDGDKGGRAQWVAWLAERMAEARRVLRPGAVGLVWALPRTSHWTATALEDAGFVIEDRVSHVFGSGFPKHKSKLKPAVEDWWLVRSPGPKWLGVEACRVGYEDNDLSRLQEWSSKYHGRDYQTGTITRERATAGTNCTPPNSAGRWPPHLVLSHSPACNGVCAEGCPVRVLGEQSGEKPASWRKAQPDRAYPDGIFPQPAKDRDERGHADTGTAARFFPQFDAPFIYCSKASRRERNAGCEGLEERSTHILSGGITSADHPDTAPGGGERTARNHHPTVKAQALMRWLVRLACPPGGVVLDPFMGSGSTGCAAVAEGMGFVGIEAEAEYLEIARARIAHAVGPVFAEAT